MLPRLLGERGRHRPRRGLRHRARRTAPRGCRAATTRSWTSSSRGGTDVARACGADGAAARHAPAAQHAGPVTRRRRHHVELVRADVGERPVRLVNAVLRRVGRRSRWPSGWTDVAPARVDRPGRAPRRAALAPALDRRRVPDACWARTEVEAAAGCRQRGAAVTLAGRPGLAVPTTGRRRVDAGTLVAVRRRARRAATRARSRTCGPGGLGVQDEGSQLVALALAAADGRGSRRALARPVRRARAARPRCSPAWPASAARCWSRTSGCRTAPRWCARALRGYGPPATVVCGDGIRPPWRPGTFDRVIVDAPCTGLGALRRRPESRWRRTPDDVDDAGRRSSASCWARRSTRPGRAAWSPTSPARRTTSETRGVVDAVLAGRDDVVEEDARTAPAGRHRPGRRAAPPALAAPARHRRDVPGAAPQGAP